ncbi:MAG: helix-turn-helix transcriptional regulator [Pseudomonadota bacterium]
MTARNPLLSAPPYPVEQALKKLGADIRTARLRRNLTIAEVAQKIGAGTRAISDAEKGKPSTSIAVYAALLWAFDLLGQLKQAADPDKDEEGKALAHAKGRRRARASGGLNNDF